MNADVEKALEYFGTMLLNCPDKQNADCYKVGIASLAAIRAELERLNNQHWVDLMELDAARKAEAELAELRENYQKAGIELLHLRTDLAAARPLLKEIEEAVEDELDLTLQSMRVWEAALAYRAGRAK